MRRGRGRGGKWREVQAGAWSELEGVRGGQGSECEGSEEENSGEEVRKGGDEKGKMRE